MPPEPASRALPTTTAGQLNTTVRRPGSRGVGALLPGNRDGDTAVLAHAATVAAALKRPLTIARVLEPTPAGADPLDRHLRVLEARAELLRLTAEVAARDAGLEIRAEVVEDGPSGRLRRWAASQALDLLVLSTSDSALPGFLLRPPTCNGPSLLIVPGAACGEAVPAYTRILVPLDGSARAETALPLAARLAQGHDAELLVIHAVPPLELTEIEPLSSDDLDLRERAKRRNERVGRTYLERVRARIGDRSQPARAILLSDGDVRRHLADAIAREHIDLVVLSAHGHGASGAPYGSVATYLAAHCTAPLLVRGAARGGRPTRVRQPPPGATTTCTNGRR